MEGWDRARKGGLKYEENEDHFDHRRHSVDFGRCSWGFLVLEARTHPSPDHNRGSVGGSAFHNFLWAGCD